MHYSKQDFQKKTQLNTENKKVTTSLEALRGPLKHCPVPSLGAQSEADALLAPEASESGHSGQIPHERRALTVAAAPHAPPK